ncbi:hypothetical protein, partial [Eggerthella lenta]|uniref:hypothetical protein n=1 Tax=Eggerthella lenta TaxID=84112 RepID=UPI001C6A60EE
DAKGVGAVRTHSSAQAQPRIISRREARTDFKDPSATFSTSWQVEEAAESADQGFSKSFSIGCSRSIIRKIVFDPE